MKCEYCNTVHEESICPSCGAKGKTKLTEIVVPYSLFEYLVAECYETDRRFSSSVPDKYANFMWTGHDGTFKIKPVKVNQ